MVSTSAMRRVPDPGGRVHHGGPQKRKKKKTNYKKITLVSFLKVCLYGCCTNCQFYQISLFCPLNIVFRKTIFFKDCILNFT